MLRNKDPDNEYLPPLPSFLRSYSEEALRYTEHRFLLKAPFFYLRRSLFCFLPVFFQKQRGLSPQGSRNPSSKFLFSGKNTCLRADLPPPAAFSTGKSYCSGCRSGSPHHPDHTALPEAAPSLSPFPGEGTESAEAVCFLICNFCQTPVFFPDKPLKNLPASVPSESLLPLNYPSLFKQIITLYIYTVNKYYCRNFYSLFITDYTTRFSHISHCLQKLFTFCPFYCMMA